MSQAVIPDRGAGVVTLQYTLFTSGDHLFSTSAVDGMTSRGYTASGKRWYLGDTSAHTLLVYVDYGIYHRVGISGTIAGVASKYDGRAPVNRSIDDGAYHYTFQDLGVDVRYRIIQEPVTAALSMGFGTPLASYPDYGHAAAGRNLTELRAGAFAYERIGRASVSSSLVYSYARELESINLRRLIATAGAAYDVHRNATVELFAAYQDTPNGVDWVSGNPAEPVIHGDPSASFVGALAAARLVNLGGTIYLLTPHSTTVAVSLSSTIWGENLEDGIYASIAVSYRFGKARIKDEWGEDW